MTVSHWGGNHHSNKNVCDSDWESDWKSNRYDTEDLKRHYLNNFLVNEDIICVIMGLRFFVFAIKNGIIK